MASPGQNHAVTDLSRINRLVILMTTCCFLSDLANAKMHQILRHKLAPIGFSRGDVSLSTPMECLRPCRENEPPKICYYHFTLEIYSAQGLACSLCTPNMTNDLNHTCQCVTADGVERTILAVNRMLPGPSIQVCQGDKIVVDVENLMQGMETTIHWHGIYQTGTPYQDGVPFVTQCPIATGVTHRYQFKATNQGTHFWHSHDALQKMDGIYGSLIVREPPQSDPNSHLYDYDTPSTVMVISDWLHREATEHYPGLLDTPGQIAEAVLIHGRGQWMNQTSKVTTISPLAVYTVKQGKRYRFRMINAFCTVCPAELSFQNHDMTVIASDGEDLQPVSASILTSYAGERYDFIIDARQAVGTYWIRVRAVGECSGPAVQQYGILRYEGGPDLPTSEQPLYNQSFAQGLILNSANSNVCSTSTQPIDGNLCASGFRSALPVDKEILKSVPDFKFYLPSGFVIFPNTEIFTPNTYLQYYVPPTRAAFASVINNISFVSPPAPLISQRNDIPLELICNGENLPKNCDGSYCACTHVLSVPLNAVVEIVFCDAAPQSGVSHPFHLHGNAFRIIGMGASADPSVTVLNATTIRDLDRRGLLVRNFDQPPAKDTAIIPSNGYLITRFLANNPGYWLYHCHFVFHSIAGMEVVIQVGDVTDIPPVPQNFPTCGDYSPKILPISK